MANKKRKVEMSDGDLFREALKELEPRSLQDLLRALERVSGVSAPPPPVEHHSRVGDPEFDRFMQRVLTPLSPEDM